MSVSLEKACEALRTWRNAGQSIDVSVSGGRSSITFLACSGKVGEIGFSEFIVTWGSREQVRISLGAKFELSESGSLRLLFSESEAVVITEALS